MITVLDIKNKIQCYQSISHANLIKSTIMCDSFFMAHGCEQSVWIHKSTKPY